LLTDIIIHLIQICFIEFICLKKIILI
jgi:hypothetical protein